MAKKPPPPPRKCGTCGGSGKQYKQVDGKVIPITCTVCKGSGRA